VARVASTTACLALLALTLAREARAVSDPHGILVTTRVGSAAAPEDETARVSVAELRQTLPDLQLRDSPPPALFALQFGMHLPYQVLGLGLDVELYPTRWLRFSGLYSFGFSPIDHDVTASHYAEAAAGVAVFDTTSDSAIDLPTRAIPNTEPFTLKTFVPRYHALFVEAGALTGFFSPARCTANCSDDLNPKTLVPDSRQFVMPFVGLRYVSYYRAASERARLQKRSYLQVYAHLFAKAFNAPGYPIYDYKGELFAQNPVGGRVGFEAPPWGFCLASVLHMGCAQGGMAVGYNPTPGFAFVEFHISYLID
jgi:hypothetical protein